MLHAVIKQQLYRVQDPDINSLFDMWIIKLVFDCLAVPNAI